MANRDDAPGGSPECVLTAAGEWSPCAAMDAVLPEANANTKGLVLLCTVNLDEFNDGGFTQRPLGVVYRKSARERGVLLNRCPWCSADLSQRFKAKSKPRQQEGDHV